MLKENSEELWMSLICMCSAFGIVEISTEIFKKQQITWDQ